MNARRTELWVGLFLLTGAMAMVFLSVKIGTGRFFTNDSYLIKARFSDVGGLKPGSKVLLAGVAVGQVGEITLDKVDYVAIVELMIHEGIELDEDTIASIRTQGLIGDKYVGLLPGGSGIPLEPGSIIIDTESAVDIEGLISKVAFGTINETNEGLPENDETLPNTDTTDPDSGPE